MWVVVGYKTFKSVPKAGVRKKLNTDGRVKKVAFRRAMCGESVKKALMEEFPWVKWSSPTFMKAIDNKMVKMEYDGFPSGYEVHNCASKESLYVIAPNEDKPQHTNVPQRVGTSYVIMFV